MYLKNAVRSMGSLLVIKNIFHDIIIQMSLFVIVILQFVTQNKYLYVISLDEL